MLKVLEQTISNEYMTTNNNNRVPQLRFPGFTGEWVVKKLGDCFEIGNGRDYKHLSKGNIPVYGSGGYMCSVNDYLFDGDSACIGRKGTINNPTFLQGKFWTVDTLFYTYDFKNTFAYFVYLLFQNIDWMRHNEAGGVPSLSKGIIKNIKVLLPPSLAEQQKIADCLSSLDEEIAAEAQKADALKDHKKGLMQQLFPQPGQTTPQRRFPGFEGEWEASTISDIFEIRNGYTPSKRISEYWEGGTIPWFRMEDIRENGGILADAIQHITPLGVKGKGLFKKNSIILATTATIGIHAMLIADSLANQRFTNFSIRESLKHLYSPIYVYYAFFGIDEWCKKNTNAGGLLSVNMPSLLKQPFPTPTLAEQQKIADCLSELDEMISAQQQKVEALKEHKKGLMQKLFPKIN